MKKNNLLPRSKASGERGFTLIEVMISALIMTCGLVAVLGALCSVMAANQTAQADMLARQIASESMEAVYTARNDSEMTWTEINNVANGGIFVNGYQSVLCAGPDGILGTADDAACTLPSGATCPNGGVQCMDEPGPDGILGDADDVIVSFSNYKRQITIAPLYDTTNTLIPTLRQVTINVQYTVPNQPVAKTYTLTEYVSSYH